MISVHRGRELQKRLEEREKEMELDARDRQKEKEEIEELRAKIFASESTDPNAEFEKVSLKVHLILLGKYVGRFIVLWNFLFFIIDTTFW